MILEWMIPMTVEFPERDIQDITNYMLVHGWNEDKAYDMIHEIVLELDDSDYYCWGEEQTQEVLKEIKRRVGGEQLSMFKNE